MRFMTEARDRFIRRPGLVLFIILLLAAALRLVALGRVPPGPSYDELQNARLSERILANQLAIYFPENFGQEPLYPALTAAMVRLLGWSVISIRTVGGLAGVLSVATLYFVARELADRRAAILASAFYAVSFWALIETRVGLETALLPPLSGLAVFFLARGLRQQNQPGKHGLFSFAVAGLFLGGHVYAYTPGRVMPLLPIALLGYLLLVERSRLRRGWSGWLTLLVVMAAVAAPLVLFLRAHPGAEVRLDQLAGPLKALRRGNPRPLLDISVRTLGMFSFRGEPQWLYNVAERPVFDPLTSVLFYVGVVWCSARLRDWRYGLVLLWLLVGLGPGMVSPPAASFTHTLAAQPAVYLLLGMGADAVWQWLSERRSWLGPSLVGSVLILHLVLSCHAYFGRWRGAPEVRQLYQGGVSAVARELDDHTPPGPVAAGGPYVNHWHPWNAVAFDLALRREDLPVRWFNPGAAWVWPQGAGPVTYYFPVDPLGEQAFDPLLYDLSAADAELVSSREEAFTALRTSSLEPLERRLEAAALTPAALPSPTGQDVALPLRFGDRFRLLGAEVDDDRLVAGAELRVTTYWEVLSKASEPVVAFVHLTSDGSHIWGQHDGLDVWPPSLEPGDRFAQVHQVPVRSRAPTGPYHVEVGLYHPETLQRLPVMDGEKSVADRVMLGGEIWVSVP